MLQIFKQQSELCDKSNWLTAGKLRFYCCSHSSFHTPGKSYNFHRGMFKPSNWKCSTFVPHPSIRLIRKSNRIKSSVFT